MPIALMIVLLRIILLIASFYGYVQWMSGKIRPEFSLGIMFSGIGSALFFAGILNILQETAWCIMLGGLFLAACSFKEKTSPKKILTTGVIFFLLAAVYFGVLLYGQKFVHYDDFSHWATAVKILIKNNRFPNFLDKNFTFSAYPLGSASIIYYFVQITGCTSEWMQMYAQSLVMTSFAAGFFSLGKKYYSVVLAGTGSVFLLCSNLNFNVLLVDTLLPMAALGAMAFCIYYSNENLSEKLYFLVPYTIFLISIKNSGILFAIFIIVYALCCTGISRENRKAWAVLVSGPLLSLLLWQKHVKLVFKAGNLSKHSISFSNFDQIFQEKDFSNILTISEAMLDKVLSVSNPAIIVLLMGMIIWIFWKYILKYDSKQTESIFLLTGISYIIYQLGTYGMYLFTMPVNEAVRLAGYDRYHNTILIFAMGLVLFQTMEGIRQIKSVRWGSLLACGLVLVSLSGAFVSLSPRLEYYSGQVTAGREQRAERQKFENIISDHNIKKGKNYIILVSQDRKDSGYLRYLSNYLLEPNQLKIQNDAQLKDIRFDNTDYIIVFNETEPIKIYIEQNLGNYPGPVIPIS